jgi:hypothetical protein
MRRNSSSNRNAFGVLAGNSRLNGLDENVGFHLVAQISARSLFSSKTRGRISGPLAIAILWIVMVKVFSFKLD